MSSNFATALVAGIVAALISGLVTIVGWFVTRDTEEKKRQLETDLRHLERQMEELYGPLLGLVRQQKIAYKVVTQLVPTKEGGGGPDIEKFGSDQTKVWNFVAGKYLIPIQRQMTDLLWGKVYLLESDRLPDS